MPLVHEQEHATEVIDQASNTETMFRNAGIENARAAAAPETHPDFNGRDCVECGDEIPLARRLLFKVRCVACQERRERVARMNPR